MPTRGGYVVGAFVGLALSRQREDDNGFGGLLTSRGEKASKLTDMASPTNTRPLR
ncbi:MAG: hypothetical protein ACJ0UT_02280 [Candidatus Latescibacterota bacterium]